MSRPTGTTGRPHPRRRSVSDSLLSIVLVLESLLVFFATLVVFALDVLPPLAAFIGGAVFVLVTLVTARIVRYPIGVAVGWIIQIALVASGFLVPMMFFIGAGFAALWIYCFITGRRLDSRGAGHPPQPSTPTEENA
jgi:hypothetical protein